MAQGACKARNPLYSPHMTKEEAITEVQKIIREHGLTLKDYQSHSMKGVKLPAKVVGPNGETWAGRGMKPKWMTQNELA